MGAEAWAIVGNLGGLLAAGIGTLLLVIYKSMEGRVRAQEIRIEQMERAVNTGAERQREHIKTEVHDFRGETRETFAAIRLETAAKREEQRTEMFNFRTEISNRVETVRTETNKRLDDTNIKLDGLVTQVGALAVLQSQRHIDWDRRGG